MASSTHHACADHALKMIGELDLDDGVSVYKTRYPTDRLGVVGDPPFVTVSPYGQEQFGDGDTEDLEVGFPVAVAIVEAANQDLTAEDPRVLARREAIVLFFLAEPNQDVGDGNAYRVAVEPGPVLDLGAAKDSNLWVSLLTLRYWAMLSKKRA